MDPLLESHTRSRFALLETDPVEVRLIDKGGSDRKFYRIRLGSNQSLVLVKYGVDREENVRYAQIAVFLESLGVRVPKIFHHDTSEGLIWMEDLGERDLWSFRDEPWQTRRSLYESALDEVHILHREGIAALQNAGIGVEREFDAALYRWEQNYFFEHCAERYFGATPAECAAISTLPVLSDVADALAALPRVLVHRDFQSQNILVSEGSTALIDFQGLRPGLPEYDIASLLYDPYVEMSEEERGALAGYYREGLGDIDYDFLTVLRLCAMQRLMQALGAYGYLGLVRGKTSFLSHIPRALDSLVTVTASVSSLEAVSNWLAALSLRK